VPVSVLRYGATYIIDAAPAGENDIEQFRIHPSG
jgi:hypothetical protein